MAPAQDFVGGIAGEEECWQGKMRHGKVMLLTTTPSYACRSLDAALVSPGEPWAIPRVSVQPDLAEGMAFNLVNNLWG